MISINSYIFKNRSGIELQGEEGLSEVISNPNLFFIDIKDIKGEDLIDDFYIEGAIVISYKGRKILDFKEYDLIDQLWTNFMHSIIEYKESGFSEFYFPDQPKLVRLKSSDKHFVLSVDKEELLISKPDEGTFLNALLESANYFFNKITKYTSQDYSYQLEELKKNSNWS